MLDMRRAIRDLHRRYDIFPIVGNKTIGKPQTEPEDAAAQSRCRAALIPTRFIPRAQHEEGLRTRRAPGLKPRLVAGIAVAGEVVLGTEEPFRAKRDPDRTGLRIGTESRKPRRQPERAPREMMPLRRILRARRAPLRRLQTPCDVVDEFGQPLPKRGVHPIERDANGVELPRRQAELAHHARLIVTLLRGAASMQRP
ncbi:MAG: hypothetical protein WCE44_00845 [Candidatus Velthaea sp.]